MRFFSRWFTPTPPSATAAAQLRAEAGRFAVAAFAHLDRVRIEREVRQQKLVLAFFFGAIDELARLRDLDEAQALAAGVMFLNDYFPASTPELGSITELRQEYAQALQARNLMREGAEAIKRWRAGDGDAAKWLAQSLAFDEGNESRAARHDSRDGGGRAKQDARADG